ncbi:MAG: MFS transporter [Candidatus Bathyarchaeota archaeon]|nr:MFS transporter [Candidatus Bathyarchaeota archaeon]
MKVNNLLRNPGVLFGGFLALTVLSIMNSAYSYVLTSIKGELLLSYTESGALMSAYFTGYTVGQIPWGLLADRFGSRRVMAVSVLGVSAATVLFGFGGDFFSLAVARFAAGLLGAGVFVPAVRLIAGWYESRERGTALGLLNVGGSIGLIVVTWASPLLALAYGWRLSIIIQGITGVASSLLVWFCLKDGVKGSGISREAVVSAFKQRSFWVLAVAQFIRLGSYYTFLAWLPLLLKEDYGLDVILVGTAMSLFNFAGMVSNPAGGMLADFIGEKKVLAMSFLLLAVNIYALTILPSGVFIFVASFLLGWLINFVRSPAFTIIPRLFGAETAGSLSGFHNTFASLGALALPLMLGIVKDTTASYDIGWFALSTLMVIGTALVALIKVPEG